MARILVALRLRLLAAQLDRPGRIVGAMAGAFAVGLFAAFGTLLAVIGGVAPDGTHVAVLAAAGLWLAWVVVPLLAPVLGAGLDESLDPAALALLPVRGRELVPGMLLAGLIGPAAWATVAVVIGLSASHVRSVPGGVLAVLVALVLTAVCVGSGRAAVTVLSRRSASRRRRDAAFIVVAMLLAAAVATVAPLLLSSGASTGDVAAVLVWTPGGQLGAALREIRVDALGPALLHLGLGTLVLVLVLAGWAVALDRALVRAGGEDSGARSRSAVAALARLLPVSDPRVAAVAAKELLMTIRDPTRRSTFLVAWVVGVGSPLYFVLAATAEPAGTLAVAVAFPAFIAAGGVNLNGFGLDGPGIWTQISSSGTLGPDIRGRSVALVVLNLPPVVAAAVAFSLVGGDLAWAPVGVAAGLGVLLAVLGAGAVLSVRAPMPRADSAIGVSSGTSGRGLLISAAGVLASLAALAPGIVPVVAGARGWTPGPFVGAPLLVLCGAVVLVLGIRHATRWVDERQPELLAAVTRGA